MPELFERSLPVTMNGVNLEAPQELFRAPLPIKFADIENENGLDTAIAYFVEHESQTQTALDDRYMAGGSENNPSPAFVEDTNDPGFFTILGMGEDPDDQGTYIVNGS